MTDKPPVPAASPRPARRRLAARWKRWIGPVFSAALAIVAAVVLWGRMRHETWAYYSDGAGLRAEIGDSTLRPVLWEDPEPHDFDGGQDGEPGSANAPSGRLEAAFSADGTQMLLVRRPEADRGADIFVSRWDGRCWSRPEPVKSLNTPANERGPAFSRDGAYLYFSSDRDGGRGGHDLYLARWDGKHWTGVEPLPDRVNTAANELGPALSPDGTQLYFSSDRAGSEDIFVSNITAPASDGGKQRLAPVPEFASAKAVDGLNSQAADAQAALTTRGDHLFLASDRHRDRNSGFKIYFSRVIDGKAGVPEEVDLYIDRGDVTDPAVRMEGYDLLFSTNRDAQADPGGSDPGYRLYRSTTREVIGYTDLSRWYQFRELMHNIAWWLLLAVAALIALIYVLEKWRDITNLYHKCLAGSALVHFIALLLAALWLIAREISEDEQGRYQEIEVEMDALAQEQLALESIPEETEVTDATTVVTRKEESEFGAPDFEPREEAQDVPDAAPGAKEAVVEAKPTMSEPTLQPVTEPPAESNLPAELTATVLPEIEPTRMEERAPDEAPTAANPADEMFEPGNPAHEPTKAESAAVADQVVESEAQATEVRPPEPAGSPVESVVDAKASPPAEETPADQPPLESETLARLPQEHFVDPDTLPMEERDPGSAGAPADPSKDQFKPGSPSTLATSQAQGQAVADTAAASLADAAAVAAAGNPADATGIRTHPASSAATSEVLPVADPVAAASLPAPSIPDPAPPALEEPGQSAGAPADPSKDQFKPGSPSTLATSQAQGQAVADTAAASLADAAAVAAAGNPAAATGIRTHPASSAATSETLPVADPVAAASLPAPSIPDPATPALEEPGQSAGAPADPSKDQFKPGSPSTLATSQAQGQAVADTAAASLADAAAVAAAGNPAAATGIRTHPASSAATSETLPVADPVAAASLPAPSIPDPATPALEEPGQSAGAPADPSKDQFKPGSPSTLATSQAQGQAVADTAAASPADAAAVAAAGNPAAATGIRTHPASSAATSETLPVADPVAAASLPAPSIPDPATPALEEPGQSAGAPADPSKDQFKPGSPSTLATSQAQGQAVADTAAASPADAAAVAAAGNPAAATGIRTHPASSAATSETLPVADPVAASSLPAPSIPDPATPALEEPGQSAGAPVDPSKDQFKPDPASGLATVQSATNSGSGTAVSDAPAAGSVPGASRGESSSATMPGRALEAAVTPTPGGESLVITVTSPGSVSDSLLPAELEAPDGALKAVDMARVIRKQRGKPGLETIKQMGGSDGTEKAINAAILWLVENQEKDGRWDTLKHSAKHQYDTGASGLALLCFYGWGERHDVPCKFRENVRSALDWLLAQQDDDGYLGARTNMMYCHAIATIALCEAYGLTRDRRLRKPAERAIAYSLRAQSKSYGGWRYAPGEDSDTSITGWQYMALHSARMAGLEVPEEPFERVRKYLDRVGGGKHGGLYGYQSRANPSPAMVATGMFCRQLDLVPPDDPMMRESARWLKIRPMETSRPDLYYVYYATLALYQHQGPIWNDWNERLKETLPLIQSRTGDHTGSWEPSPNITAEGGRVVSTTLATLSLEVYYRLLPMYGFRTTEAGATGNEMPGN